MKEEDKSQDEQQEMLPEHDFSGGERGKFAHLYAQGSNIVVLSPDVAAAFPDSASVNEALRALLAIARQAVKTD